MRRDLPHGLLDKRDTSRRMRWGFWPLERGLHCFRRRTSRWPRDRATAFPSHKTPHGRSSRTRSHCGDIGGRIARSGGGGEKRGKAHRLGSTNTPSLLPHQGGGVAPLLGRDWVQATAIGTRSNYPTGRHLPLDGGGWEGVTEATMSRGYGHLAAGAVYVGIGRGLRRVTPSLWGVVPEVQRARADRLGLNGPPPGLPLGGGGGCATLGARCSSTHRQTPPPRGGGWVGVLSVRDRACRRAPTTRPASPRHNSQGI